MAINTSDPCTLNIPCFGNYKAHKLVERMWDKHILVIQAPLVVAVWWEAHLLVVRLVPSAAAAEHLSSVILERNALLPAQQNVSRPKNAVLTMRVGLLTRVALHALPTTRDARPPKPRPSPPRPLFGSA